MREHARNYAVHPAVQHARDIRFRLTHAKSDILLAEVCAGASELANANLEADARSQRRLFEQERELLAFQRSLALPSLHLVGALDELRHALR